MPRELDPVKQAVRDAAFANLRHTLRTPCAEQAYVSVEVVTEENLLLTIRVRTHPDQPPRYFTVKVSEPW